MLLNGSGQSVTALEALVSTIQFCNLYPIVAHEGKSFHRSTDDISLNQRAGMRLALSPAGKALFVRLS